MLACLVLMLNVCWDYVGAGPNLKLRATPPYPTQDRFCWLGLGPKFIYSKTKEVNQKPISETYPKPIIKHLRDLFLRFRV